MRTQWQRHVKVLARDPTGINPWNVLLTTVFRFTVKGQQGFYGKFLPKMLKRDLMYMEDRWVMKQKVCLKRFGPGNF